MAEFYLVTPAWRWHSQTCPGSLEEPGGGREGGCRCMHETNQSGAACWSEVYLLSCTCLGPNMCGCTPWTDTWVGARPLHPRGLAEAMSEMIQGEAEGGLSETPGLSLFRTAHAWLASPSHLSSWASKTTGEIRAEQRDWRSSRE